MTPQLKFLRRVRIHGGESDAVARALHHKAKIQSLPAVGGNVSFTTNERKTMSTKTSLLKRIAQTAVVALVGGLLSIVAAPASNAAVNTSISGSCIARADVGGVLQVNYRGDSTSTLVAYQSARTLAAGSAGYAIQTDVLQSHTDSSTTQYHFALSKDTITSAIATVSYFVWAKKGGSNQHALIDDSSDATAIAVADSLATTIVCTVAGAPATFSWSATSATVKAEETYTVSITPKDAAGVTTLLNTANDSISVTATTASSIEVGLQGGRPTNAAKTSFASPAGVGAISSPGYADRAIVGHGTASAVISNANDRRIADGPITGTATRLGLDAASADAGATYQVGNTTTNAKLESITSTGAFSVNVSGGAAGTITLTAAGQGTLAGMTSSAFTLTVTDAVYGTSYGFGTAAATGAAGFGIIDAATGYASGTPAITAPTKALGAGSLSASKDIYVSTARTSIPLTVQHTAGTFSYTVAAVTGYALPSGVTAGTYSTTSATTGETNTTITLTTTAPVAGQRFDVTWAKDATTNITASFIYRTPGMVGASLGSVTVSNSSDTKKVVVGGSPSALVTVRDEFGSLVNAASVNWSVAGRNPSLGGSLSRVATTSATGEASISWTDADSTASLTTYPTDTLSVAVTAGNSGSYSTTVTSAYTYVATLTAGAVAVTTNAASTGVASNGSSTFTATVTSATGAALSGYPVTFSTDAKAFATGTGAATTTAYTSDAGVATATIYAKTLGTSTVTVASGGVTTTKTFTVIASTARTIAVDAATASMAPGESKRVTATVKDAFGNVIKDASVTVKYVGTTGRVASVNGIAASTATTDVNGQVVIELTADSVGTGTLTADIGTATAGGDVATTVLSDGSARPARVFEATTAVTVAGSSATVAAAEAATDAAAEAIDAANAATDAANLAAEAADAATVAAEEARDAADAATAAVEELATQVATLMAALKAQITTLANTVAKIAKKVKA